MTGEIHRANARDRGQAPRRESVSREIARAGQRILGKYISAHSLRHAFATAAIKAGWSAKKVAAQLGNSSRQSRSTCTCRMHRAGRTWPSYGAISPRAKQKARTRLIGDALPARCGAP
jgi:integrase